ncbi:MAG: serine/threonine-protein kinase [Synergistaceae bacterium]|jgi:serine/threonine protein kinase|nr:serine/threonine-protein kinase [Synergistaceae bacterium]
MKEFPKGHRIKVVSGSELEVVNKLGEGGQGIVYRVNYNGKEFALKWYFPKLQNPVDFYDNIRSNIAQGAPTRSFLWPLEITERQDGSFGYLMNLRPQNFKDFSRFLLAKERFASLSALIDAALCIVGGFKALHNNGYSYQDLNDGNFFIDPKIGEVLICDNDNVAPYGQNLGIAGKCRYMAPEIVMSKKLPDIHTDRFSLAVILFMLLFYNHPLEGKKTMCPCLTEELERKFYGSEPVFIYDPQDTSNLPVRGVHTNVINFWPLFPNFIHQAFAEAFSKEVLIGSDIEHRTTEKRWQEVFTSLRDKMIKCSCGNETFIDVDSPSSLCIDCRKQIAKPPVLKVKKYQVVLYPGNKIFKCHVASDSDDFSEAMGEVITSRLSQDTWGLRNNSNTSWAAVSPNGERRTVNKGSVVPIVRGFKINFGNNPAEIV